MLEDAALAPAPRRVEAVERAWANLVGPGSLLTASERQQVIRDARSAWAGAAQPNGASGVAGEAAHWLAVDAEGMNAEIVADFESRGLDRLQYLEIVGIVGRLSNVDFYVRGLGATELELTQPSDAAPSGTLHADAELTNMWVPTVGVSFAPLVLDALPDEGEALRDLHEPMYIDMVNIGDGAYADELTKAQVEYLAARTSYLNECFYWLLAHTAFLRASSDATDLHLDVTVVASGEPPAVAHGAELAALAQAMGTRWTESPTAERDQLVAAAGPQAAERAVGVAATFQMMNRLLDGVGAPVHERLHPLALELGYELSDIPR